MTGDWHPELDNDDGAPVRGERHRRMLRFVVLVALGAMVLPLVLSGYGVAVRAAAQACALTVAAFDTSSTGSRIEFSLAGRGGPGWLCFADAPSGERLVANLGIMPGGVPPGVRGVAT
ncbi:hypothetical protein ACDF64_17920 [Agromyces sp. MMS24-JH15]|uniref:hypothetical protein n=1 Tax=Agromyces sp. MMS24-JH15 TaxID=3243765 RepID=UPI00374A8CF1